MGYIALPSILNALTSYYCLNLKIVILYDGTKTIQNGVFPFCLKKNKILFIWKKQEDCFFFEKQTVFLKPPFQCLDW